MKKCLVRPLGVVGSLLSALVLFTSLTAAPLNTESSLMCAAIDVVACLESPGCIEGRASSFDLPDFMLVNFNEKKVHAVSGNDDEVASPINVVEVSDNQIILQGIDNNRGWTAAIDRLSGKLVVTLAGTDVSFSMFGTCTSMK